jgi:Apea-like HEPN
MKWGGTVERFDDDGAPLYKISAGFERALNKSGLIHQAEIYFRSYIILLRDFNEYYEWIEVSSGKQENDLLDVRESAREEQLVKKMTRSLDRSNVILEILHGNIEETFANGVFKLLSLLRLLNGGHLRIVSLLYKDLDTCYDVNVQSTENYLIDENYKVIDNNLESISELMRFEYSIAPFIKLALDSFNESYNVKNEKLRFILLTIALESIYSTKSQDITHILARHVALTLCEDNEELFLKIEKQVRTLYGIRSIIVHGKAESGDLKKIHNMPCLRRELEDIVRKVLKTLLFLQPFKEISKTKETLYASLNSKGFVR